MTDSFEDLIGFSPPLQPVSDIDSRDNNVQKKNVDISDNVIVSTANSKEENQDKPRDDEILLGIAISNIDKLFRDQLGDCYASVLVKDHYETISLKSDRFKRYLSKLFYDHLGKKAKSELINNVLNLLQAKAEFGENQYKLSLRVAEHDGDFYYDLTNEKHQAIKIAKEGHWEIIDKTPVPLFKRYNQTSQDLPAVEYLQSLPTELQQKDPLDYFISNLTNIKDNETKLIIKVVLISWFIPEIPHISLIVHGSEGSAKSTFLLLVKEIVDPAKPTLLTLHENRSEFIQQLAHNYLAAYDNLKYNPKWLPDEACKAITGVGQTKRSLYTDDDDKVFEYKHCLMFNGINAAFSEPDILNRSLLVEQLQIEEENRKTEQDILKIFYKIRPHILKYIFDVLAKAITVKNKIKISRLPRMADSAIWGEAISLSRGYRDGEFIKAYRENIGFQNNEVIDSTPLAYAIKILVEKQKNIVYTTNSTEHIPASLFEGSPISLLIGLKRIALEEQIDINQRDWPKDTRWLTRRIKTIRSSLQKSLGIKVIIGRDEKNNSLIKIERNDSNDSMASKMTPEVELLSLDSNSMTPDSGDLTPENSANPSAESVNSGVNGVTGDKQDLMIVRDIASNIHNEVIMSKENTVSSSCPNSVELTYPQQDELVPCTAEPHAENIKIDESYYECYYCDNFPSSLSKNRVEYEKHVIQIPPGTLAYPSKADLNKNNIPQKGKVWEL
jgi:hypothetical protein